MEPNTTPGTSPELNTPTQATPATTDSQPQPAPKKSSNIFLILLTIISLAAAATFAVLFFMNQPKPTPDNQAGSSEQNPSETESDTEEKLTDTYIIRDLDEKISILLHNDETGPSFNSGHNIVTHDVSLFKNGNYDQIIKAGIVIQYIAHTLDYAKSEAVISGGTYDDRAVAYFRSSGISGATGEEVRQKYLDLFGENLPTGAKANFYCGEYKYNAEQDFYYSDALGCGGMTPYVRHYYKSDYTFDENHAYVYVSTALLDEESGNIYCDIASFENDGVHSVSSDAKVCDTVSSYSNDFSLNASNYESYSKYRFVFQKADDGTYFFEKVERL